MIRILRVALLCGISLQYTTTVRDETKEVQSTVRHCARLRRSVKQQFQASIFCAVKMRSFEKFWQILVAHLSRIETADAHKKFSQDILQNAAAIV
jgi:hypothetical protein